MARAPPSAEEGRHSQECASCVNGQRKRAGVVILMVLTYVLPFCDVNLVLEIKEKIICVI